VFLFLNALAYLVFFFSVFVFLSFVNDRIIICKLT